MSEIEEAKAVSESSIEKREVAIPSVKQIDVTLLTEDYVRLVERQIELRSKLLMTAVKATKPHDWVDFGGKPYLEGEGGWRIMSAVRGFKVGETIFSGDKEQIDGHYYVEAATEVEWMGQTTIGLGDCSTIDSFFTGKDGDAGKLAAETKRTGNAQIAARLILGDAKKKARENSISRAVTELMGLKGLKWEDLAELGYGASTAGAKVEFKTGSQGGQTGTYTVTRALQATKGSKFNLQGQIVSFQERTPKTKILTDYTLSEPGTDSTVKVTCWGNATEGAANGRWLYCENVVVDEYQGRVQYQAKSVSIVELEAPAPEGDPLLQKSEPVQGEIGG